MNFRICCGFDDGSMAEQFVSRPYRIGEYRLAYHFIGRQRFRMHNLNSPVRQKRDLLFLHPILSVKFHCSES